MSETQVAGVRVAMCSVGTIRHGTTCCAYIEADMCLYHVVDVQMVESAGLRGRVFNLRQATTSAQIPDLTTVAVAFGCATSDNTRRRLPRVLSPTPIYTSPPLSPIDSEPR